MLRALITKETIRSGLQKMVTRLFAVVVIILCCCSRLSQALGGRDALEFTLARHRAVSALIESEEFTSIIEEDEEISLFTAQDVLDAITSEDVIKDLSQECREDLRMIVKRKIHPTMYPGFIRYALLPMKDSAGIVGKALLRGHLYFAGHYSECKEIDYQVPGRERSFRTDYFRLDIDPLLRPNNANGSCEAGIPSLPGIEVYYEMGVCLPASCSSKELTNAIRQESHSTNATPICRLKKTADDLPDSGVGFYITSAVMCTIFAICVISGLVDFYFGKRLETHPIAKSLGWQLFMACSMYTNIGSIFDVSEAGKGGQIGPIHCIRFFSMCWVLLGHLFSTYLGLIANPLDVLALTKDITSEAVINALYAVDSFFFISGVLLSFLWFKTFKRNPKQTNSIYGWIMFYVHRILRLSPAYYMLVFFYTFVLRQLQRDTPLNMNPLLTVDYCSSSWWVELLYLVNFVNVDLPCLGYSWYLAADMQMYLFTPLLLIPLAYKPVLGFIVAGAVFTLSTATNIFLVFHYHWPTNFLLFHPADPLESGMEHYNMYMYDSPLIRCQIYIMGMLVGWLLQTKKTMKIHPVVYLTGWVIGISLMLTVLLGLHDQTNGETIDVFWRAMYSALSRPAWGLGLSVIIIFSFYGYGGPINSFMSWHIWVPLGRLSYCAYLIHIPVLTLILGESKDEIYFSNFTEFFITRVVAIVVVVFFTSTFWSACFENSFGRIEKLLLGGVRVPARDQTMTAIHEEEKVMKIDVEAISDSSKNSSR